jgi:hypothetical protein
MRDRTDALFRGSDLYEVLRGQEEKIQAAVDQIPEAQFRSNSDEQYPPIQLGDYATWFARKSYELLATQPGPEDTAIALSERATRRW